MEKRLDRYSKWVLTVIAAFLGIIALRPAAQPRVVSAAAPDYPSFYVEPGVTVIRNPNGVEQVQGKVMIDLRTGNIWGFPTLSGAPYPVNPMRPEPPVSTPIYLGKFDFSKVTPQ